MPNEQRQLSFINLYRNAGLSVMVLVEMVNPWSSSRLSGPRSGDQLSSPHRQEGGFGEIVGSEMYAKMSPCRFEHCYAQRRGSWAKKSCDKAGEMACPGGPGLSKDGLGGTWRVNSFLACLVFRDIHAVAGSCLCPVRLLPRLLELCENIIHSRGSYLLECS